MEDGAWREGQRNEEKVKNEKRALNNEGIKECCRKGYGVGVVFHSNSHTHSCSEHNTAGRLLASLLSTLWRYEDQLHYVSTAKDKYTQSSQKHFP